MIDRQTVDICSRFKEVILSGCNRLVPLAVVFGLPCCGLFDDVIPE